jgi:predicted ribosome quality control (RQC) complex YloA/Tae2 family protein
MLRWIIKKRLKEIGVLDHDSVVALQFVIIASIVANLIQALQEGMGNVIAFLVERSAMGSD